MLGVKANYLSGVFNGKRKASQQLLKAVELLVEVNRLRKWKYDMESAQAAIQRLTAPTAAFFMNEPAANSGAADKTSAASGAVPEGSAVDYLKGKLRRKGRPTSPR